MVPGCRRGAGECQGEAEVEGIIVQQGCKRGCQGAARLQVGARVHQECKWMLGCSEGRWMPGCSGDVTGVQERARAQKGC